MCQICKIHNIYLYITFLTEGMSVKLISYCDAQSFNRFFICCNRDCTTGISYIYIYIYFVQKIRYICAYTHTEREAFYYNETYKDFVHFNRDLFIGTFVNCYKWQIWWTFVKKISGKTELYIQAKLKEITVSLWMTVRFSNVQLLFHISSHTLTIYQLIQSLYTLKI